MNSILIIIIIVAVFAMRALYDKLGK